MPLELVTAPTEEPLTLAEIREHLRLDAVSDAVTTGNFHVSASASGPAVVSGSTVDILGKQARVFVKAKVDDVADSIDVVLQDSDDGSDWTLWHTFTPITTANTQSFQDVLYTGSRRYLRVVYSLDASEAATNVTAFAELTTLSTVEDTLLTRMLAACRKAIEGRVDRQFCTATWRMHMNRFPCERVIRLPRPPLQSVTSVKYYDTAGTLQTFDSASYRALAYREPGQIALRDGYTWPSTISEPDAVQIEFVAGYGAADDVDDRAKLAILSLIGTQYENRESIVMSGAPVEVPHTLDSLCASLDYGRYP